MDKDEVARILERIADLLQIQGEPVYRVLAYRRAADSLRSLTQPVEELWKAGELEGIPAVGKAIAEKIEELLYTGKLTFYDRLSAEVPETLLELLQVPDVGPKRVAIFWKELGITTLEQLEQAARSGNLQNLPGLGERTEKRILENVEAVQSRQKDRISIGLALPLAESFLSELRSIAKVAEAQAAGSLRRGKETVGDLDFIVASDHSLEVMQEIMDLPSIRKIISHGERKISLEFEGGIRAQVWVHATDRFGSALQFATGSQSHNVKLRERALRLGLSLSEYGFKRADGTEILCPTERLVYQTLGLPWIAPELREDRGEIQAAELGRLPEMVQEQDFKGELHSHSDWSDGLGSIADMAQAALETGLSYLVITDHSRSLGVANGLAIDRLCAQKDEIDTIQKRLGTRIKLLHGAEVEILADGRLDYPNSVLAELDFVIASIHLSMRQPEEKITARYLSAIRNPHVDLIAHLSGRLIGRRDPLNLDLESVFQEAAKYGTAFEINAHPDRLDLNETNAKRAIEMGCLLAITTDAHAPEHYKLRKFGIGIARRGWVPAESLINTWEVDQLVEWLNARG